LNIKALLAKEIDRQKNDVLLCLLKPHRAEILSFCQWRLSNKTERL
jgi:hypothetical protein